MVSGWYYVLLLVGSVVGVVFGVNIFGFMNVLRIVFRVFVLLCLILNSFGFSIVLYSMLVRLVLMMWVIVFMFMLLCSCLRLCVCWKVVVKMVSFLCEVFSCSCCIVWFFIDRLLCSMIFIMLCRCLLLVSFWKDISSVECRFSMGVECLEEVVWCRCLMNGMCLWLIMVVSILVLFLKC